MATTSNAIPTLELIQIASPCMSDWQAMVGDERARHCRECNLQVYNLSDMTREEAETFLAQAEGRVCVRLFRRADGTVITRDCPVGLAAVRAKFVRVSWAAVGLLLAFGATALASLGKLSWFEPSSEGKIQSIFYPDGSLGMISCPPPLNLPEVPIRLFDSEPPESPST